jgi:hypothetical protein
MEKYYQFQIGIKSKRTPLCKVKLPFLRNQVTKKKIFMLLLSNTTTKYLAERLNKNQGITSKKNKWCFEV